MRRPPHYVPAAAIVIATSATPHNKLLGYEMSSPEDLYALHASASAFRAAIESAVVRAGSKLPVSFAHFPSGSCGDAAILLGEFLRASGFGEADFVSGCDGERTHAWIEKDGVVIDITADQFDRTLPGVLVTRAPSLHLRFRVRQRHRARIEHYDEVTAANLREALSIIMSAAQEPNQPAPAQRP